MSSYSCELSYVLGLPLADHASTLYLVTASCRGTAGDSSGAGDDVSTTTPRLESYSEILGKTTMLSVK